MFKRSFVIPTLCAASMLVAVSGSAQSVTARIAQGDKAYAALDPAAALKLYESALAVDSINGEALWKASVTAVVLGEFAGRTRDSLYHLGEVYGRRAVKYKPSSAEARFAIAHALGRIAMTVDDPAQRVPYARETYRYAARCLQIDSAYVECSHVLGAWNLEAMKVSAMERKLAISMLGARELSHASWDSAQMYLQTAIKVQPKRVIHHLDLARVYAAMHEKDKAKAEYTITLGLPAKEFNDKQYQAAAKKELDAL